MDSVGTGFRFAQTDVLSSQYSDISSSCSMACSRRGSSPEEKAREEKQSSIRYAILSTFSRCLVADQNQRRMHHEKSRRRFVYDTRWCRGIAW
jgi:hypothetical protein